MGSAIGRDHACVDERQQFARIEVDTGRECGRRPPSRPAANSVVFEEGDFLFGIERRISEADVGGEQIFVPGRAFMLVDVFEAVPWSDVGDSAAEFFFKLAMEGLFAGRTRRRRRGGGPL